MNVQKTMIVAAIDEDRAVIYFAPSVIREQADVDKVAEEIQEIVRDYPFRIMVLNFARVKTLSSSFLGKIVKLNNELKARNRKLRVCELSEEVANCFKLLKLQKVIPVYKTEEKALK